MNYNEKNERNTYRLYRTYVWIRMVVAYLEKIREKIYNKRIDINSDLMKAKNEKKETIEIIKLLEVNEDPNFEAFTPRQVNSFNKTKLVELKEYQIVLDEKIDQLTEELRQVEDEIEEVGIVIKAAREMSNS